MRRIVALALCTACGAESASIDAAAGGDAAIVDAVAVDGALPTCAASSFTTSAPVSALNTTANETYMRLSADELTAYFARQETEYILYVTTRPSTTAPFSVPTKVTITGNGANETTSPTVTSDGLTMYFTSNRTGTMGGRDIYRATRAVTTVDFGSITNVTVLNSAMTENDVFVLPDGSAIYFSSSRSGTSRVYRAAKQGTGFAPPDEVFSDAATVNRVVFSPDELTMLYSTGNDLRLSTRASTSISWLPGAQLTAIDSTGSELPYWISADLCRFYFGSDRGGDLDFRVAVRTPQ
jgi:hypothetical protein